MNNSDVRRPLPIGVSEYREACNHYYYVDKTLLIKDFLDERYSEYFGFSGKKVAIRAEEEKEI